MTLENENADSQLDEVLLDFLRRHDSGETIDREQFIQEHPECAEQLHSLLEAADWIETMAGPTLGNLTSQGPISAVKGSNPLAYDPNAATLDLVAARKDGQADENNPPSPSEKLEFSLSEFPALDNTQATLPCRFGEYLLVRVLGRGGMGVVYLANQLQLHRQVAIKMIRSGALATADETSRFYSEARSVAKLTHPNIVRIYHCGEQDGHHFFSMDYIPGTDLSKKLGDGPMELMHAVRYVRDVASAVHYAHENGIVHRDLKPANVLIDEQDQVVLTDFGLAKQIECEQGLTATGATLGTPSYMSPEQASGKTEDQGTSTDVYAIGAILFALLTGKPPFQAETVMATMMQVIHRPAPSVRQYRSEIHSDLETIVGKCLEKQKSLRYASAKAVAEDLDRFLNGHPIEAKPPSLPRRVQFWISNIPIVAALAGGKQVEPSRAQRWAQHGIIASMVLALAGLMFGSDLTKWFTNNRLPSRITIASGTPGGMYYDIAGKLSERMRTGRGSQPSVNSTGGSLENLRQLLEHQSDIALMQESTVRDDQVAVIAPLFYEAIHVLVPMDSNIHRLEDLDGHAIVMGSKDSGTRQAAQRLLKDRKFETIDGDWTQPEMRNQGHVLMAVIKSDQLGLSDLLSAGTYRILPIENAAKLALSDPMFRVYEFKEGAYRGAVAQATPTLATAAFLVARRDAPSRLIEECLSAIYDGPALTDDMIPRELAAGWQGLPYHPAARRYFATPPSGVP
ncbi:MAG: serine/threonine-protein kinase [Planctomycetota bacterium]